MQFSSQFITSPLLWGVSWVFMLCCLLWSLWRAPWRAWARFSVRQHALLGSIAILSLIWSFRFEVLPGLYFHPFLTVALTLIFGVPLSLLAGALAAGLVVLFGKGVWLMLPLDWLFTVLVPSGFSWLLLWVLGRLRTRNLFFYILGLGFFGTILITGINCLLLLAFFYWLQPERVFLQLWDNIVFAVPLIYAEGFINGVIVTSVTVYAPDLVKSFDDQRFLNANKP